MFQRGPGPLDGEMAPCCLVPMSCTLVTEMFCLMCNMQGLYLKNNKIGDVGLQAFADALGTGALASLEKIIVGSEHKRHPQLVAACQPRGIQIA